jgi:hypothetical protein
MNLDRNVIKKPRLMAPFHVWNDIKSVCPSVTVCCKRLVCIGSFWTRLTTVSALNDLLVWSSQVSPLALLLASVVILNLMWILLYFFWWKPQNLKPVSDLLYPFNVCTVFMFEFPCIISLYYKYIKNQQDATLAVLFISNFKITLHVSEAFCVHHQEYWKLY